MGYLISDIIILYSGGYYFSLEINFIVFGKNINRIRIYRQDGSHLFMEFLKYMIV